MLGSALTVRELDAEVAKALTFKPPLATVTVATSGPADAAGARRVGAAGIPARSAGR